MLVHYVNMQIHWYANCYNVNLWGNSWLSQGIIVSWTLAFSICYKLLSLLPCINCMFEVCLYIFMCIGIHMYVKPLNDMCLHVCLKCHTYLFSIQHIHTCICKSINFVSWPIDSNTDLYLKSMSAMDKLQMNTCIKFREQVPSDEHVVRFTEGTNR